MKRSVLLFLILIFSMGSVFSQQWQKVGPYNGNGPALLDLIQETSNPQILYAASNGGGIFKSFDKGDSWEKISQNFITGDMGSLAASAGNPDVIYVCGSGGRILKSIDGGSEWANISGNLPASYITDVEIRQGSGEIYVAMSGPAYGEGGLFVTEDEMNWVEISQDFTIKKVVCFEINPTNPHCFYAGT
nr:hypothetical protein [Bacteroidota bacterium]